MPGYETPSVDIHFPYYNLTVDYGTGGFTVTLSSVWDSFPASGITTMEEFLTAIKSGLLAELPAGSTVQVEKIEKTATQIIAP